MRKLIVLGLVGLVAQFVDGSLGMAYGVTIGLVCAVILTLWATGIAWAIQQEDLADELAARRRRELELANA